MEYNEENMKKIEELFRETNEHLESISCSLSALVEEMRILNRNNRNQ